MTLRTDLRKFGEFIDPYAGSFTSLELLRNYRLYVTREISPSEMEQRTFVQPQFSKQDWQLLVAFAAKMPSLASMRTLRLANSPFFTQEEISFFLSKTPNIEEIALTESGEVTDSLLEKISEFCPRLKKIDISSCCRVSDKGLKALGKCKELASIAVAGCPKVTDEGIAAITYSHQGLVYLNAAETNTSQEGLAQAVSYCSKIEALILGRTEADAAPLAQLKLPFLKKLFLPKMRIRDEDLHNFGDNAPNVEEVNLKDSKRFSLGGLKSALRSWKALRCIVLAGGPFSEEEIELLRIEFPDLNIVP